MESNFQPTGPAFKEEPPMTPQDVADAKARRDAAMMKTNETEKPPSVNEAVRAKIAEMRKNAVLTRIECKSDAFPSARVEVAALLDDAATALEAVLDAAPCVVCGVAPLWTDRCQRPEWLEAALTRAIKTKGEQ